MQLPFHRDPKLFNWNIAEKNGASNYFVMYIIIW